MTTDKEDIQEILDVTSTMVECMIEDEKLIPLIAKLIKKMYDELIKVGFSPEIAMQAASSIGNSLKK